jgi:hypothetical protein
MYVRETGGKNGLFFNILCSILFFVSQQQQLGNYHQNKRNEEKK